MSLAVNGSWKEPIPDEMHRTIVWASLGLGFTGLFGVFTAHGDLAVIVPAWGAMIWKLSDQACIEFDRDAALKLAGGLAAAIGGLVTGVKVAEAFLAYTGVGTIPAMVCNAGTNAAVTYIVGRSIARVFLASDSGTSVEEMVAAVIRLIHPHR